MGTYASNAEIQFDTGRSVVELLDEDLTETEQENVIRIARERAFEKINARLVGRTAIPAFHIPSLKQVEIDYVLSDLVVSAYTMETVNQSEWAEKYLNRAEEVLNNLHFEASAETPVPYRGNTGNGRLTIIDVFSEHCRTEVWTFRAISATEFSVIGSIQGSFPNLTVDVNYPEKDWNQGLIKDYGLTLSNYPTVGNTPFTCKITSGSVDFVDGDVFTVKTYSSAKQKQGVSSGKLMRA